MLAYLDHINSPLGLICFAVNAQGSLLGIQFQSGVYALTLGQSLVQAGFNLAHPGPTAQVKDQLTAYFAGERQRFDLPLALRGSAFQIAVWQELMRIPYGQTRTYGHIAQALGKPGAARAVGRANATNHLPIVIPCHRVIGTDGSLTGFAGGVHLKAQLLAFEGVQHPQEAQQVLALTLQR